MEPIDFPFAHRNVVRNIVSDVKRLSDESLAADKDIHDIKRASKALAEKYKNNITAVAELPAGVEAFAERFNVLLLAARDGASRGVSCITDFDETVTGAIEAIKTQKNLDDAILELKEIAKQEPQPLEGFPGAEQKFGYIWTTALSDAAKMQKVLEESTDIEKTVEELTEAFAPAKEGYKKVKEALRVYAATNLK
ncbi:hypothetical protein AGABI2DRAFT_194402 [Agaricus bisporus var. bisporus H97]|uniref:hypothetical protein n=1 Tax=Agaricus bisporus var. bisporus (strain H97 / ATCC MYA-4626 / FGSC 10389) TaxID=936046 RepID=UPI00029F6AE4|nr:hypothetical protein AGABI2DRAFT_194402 [Agaricus bisporus var. bisporus H97]EKV44314.1 hypothetical protein AGABI2DRAFT_194402 [Agaricus bisporus var. bisporus H97]